MANLFNYLSEGIRKTKCKYGHDYKKCETCGIRYKYCNCFLECTNFRDDLIDYKYLCCSNNSEQKFDEKSKEGFLNTYKYSKHDHNKFILLT